MNAVEIEQAISELAEQPFNPVEFPHAILTAFGNKDATIKRLCSGGTNKSDFAGPWGGVLQTNNIHLAACAPGAVAEAQAALRTNPLTARAQARFILATDGVELEASPAGKPSLAALLISQIILLSRPTAYRIFKRRQNAIRP